MRYPAITVDLGKIAGNAGIVVKMCREAGVSVMGVAKACCGDPDVADAIRRGGVEWLGDSRLQNIARLRRAGCDFPVALIRLPMPSEAREAVELAEMSLVSELAAARALSAAALAARRRHKVILMVELGDLREGIMPENVLPAARKITALRGVELHGLGVNFACYGGVVPTRAKLRRLVDLTERVRKATGLPVPVVSGGNSSSLSLVADGIPPGVNQLRIGEGILLGRDTIARRPLPGARQDAFSLHGEIIELRRKPSRPDGEIATDAFGNAPAPVDRGIRRRAILAVGRHDIAVEGLTPADKGAEILGASSDHLLVDVTGVRRGLRVGSIMKFVIGQYAALISGMMSQHVDKVML